MGLLSAIVGLPLAPLRGVMWLSEVLLEEAERHLYDDERIKAALLELDEAAASGLVSQEEASRRRSQLIEIMIAARRARSAGG